MSVTTDIPPKPQGCFRLVTWNCAGGLAQKFDRLAALEPDVAVVSEACTEAALLRAGISAFSSMAWVGRYPHKGLAVLGFGSTRAKMLSREWDHRLQWVLPARVTGTVDFVLLGICDQSSQAKDLHRSETFDRAAGQLCESYSSFFAAGPVVVAGDFNNHPVFDTNNPRRDFVTLVDRYRTLGLVSALHDGRSIEHGDPTEPPTHWWRWSQDRPFHIDYCFVPQSWAPATKQVTVGSYEQWGTTAPRSDHAPLVVDLLIDALGQAQ